jgi:hypothetical protein
MASNIDQNNSNTQRDTKIVLTIEDELRCGKIITKTDIRREGGLISVNFEYDRGSGIGTDPEDIKKVLDLCNVSYKSNETRYKI